jgi:WD40 repeat protein
VQGLTDGKPATLAGFSTDGLYAVTLSEDNTIRVFDVRTGTQNSSWKHNGTISAVALGPSGRIVAIAGQPNTSQSNALELFDSAKQKEIWHQPHNSLVSALSFSPDGRSLAAGTMDGTVRVFEAAAGIERSRFKVAGSVQALTFTPDNAYLVPASLDSAFHIGRPEPLVPTDLIKSACSVVSRNLTPEEWHQYFTEEPHRKTCPEVPVAQ